jgi:Flp pilus assembly protein TadG
MQWCRSARVGRRGQSLVEFALVLTLFLLALFMVMDWGWIYFQHHELTRRVTNAARWGAVNNLTADKNSALVQNVKNLVAGDGFGGVGVGNVDVDVVPSDQLYGGKRYHVVVSVTGFKYRHIVTPITLLPTEFTSKAIKSSQPAECQFASSADCAIN